MSPPDWTRMLLSNNTKNAHTEARPHKSTFFLSLECYALSLLSYYGPSLEKTLWPRQKSPHGGDGDGVSQNLTFLTFF